MGFSRQEYWSGLPFPSAGDLPDPGIKPASLTSPVLAGRLFITSATWEVPPPASSAVPGSARPCHQSLVHLSWDWATRLISRWDLGPATVAAHGPRRPAAQPRLAAAPLARSPPSLLLLLRSPSPKAGTSTTPPGQATVPGKL